MTGTKEILLAEDQSEDSGMRVILRRLWWMVCLTIPVAAISQTHHFTHADTLRGSYGPYRANNDLLFYDLRVRVDTADRSITGKNSIRFRMLAAGSRIQLDLYRNLNIDSILLGRTRLGFERDGNAVFVDFPEKIPGGETRTIDFYYSGCPAETGRFSGIAFRKDSVGNPWINTSCQDVGASVWWPNKDQQQDEVDSMRIGVEVPAGLIDVSNGRYAGREDLADGYARYNWVVHYPINSYCVSLNIGSYVHFSDTLGRLSLDFYCLPYDLVRARRQFAQAKPMLACYEKFFGDYPFPLDGYKLIEVPYSGMEHQSAVTYGNHFENGYLGKDWTGVGVSTKFDFIIVHESAHEWFGNSITSRDVSDAWIHEGWATYAECVYVECMFGHEDALKYVNGYKKRVGNRETIIGPAGVNHWPTQDMYFKGALFLNTLRSIVDDDPSWWRLIRDYSMHFRLEDITTDSVVTFFNQRTGRDFSPVFDQYLRHPDIPKLELKFSSDTVRYRWKADANGFDMPVKIRMRGDLKLLHPGPEWKPLRLIGKKEDFSVATELYYIAVEDTL